MSCEVCGKTEQLKTCAKCLRANYCSREHQIAHWQIHKQWCCPLPNNMSGPVVQTIHQPTQQHPTITSTSMVDNPVHNMSHMNDHNPMNIDNYYDQTQQMNYMVNDLAQEYNSTFLPSNNNNNTDNNNIDHLQHNSDNYNSIPESVNQFNQGFNNGAYQMSNQTFEDIANINEISNMLQGSTNNTINNQSMMIGDDNNQQMNAHPMSAQLISQRDFILQNLNRYCGMILADMNQYGFCVIDDFLQNGEQILSEVVRLYQHGKFRNGQLVSSRNSLVAKQIRGDEIVWVEYSEPSCHNVGFLIRILDTIVTRCNATRSGEFEKYNITKRTKAMIACYPGNYTKYIRHIDNPNNDGRCITSIYYLNKDYDRQKDGGVLRLFPQMNNSIVADVEPKFNRVIFFWSDRRNPHEVMPSARMRFAITVWYFDENERAKAVEKIRQTHPRYPNDKVLVPF